ncbi:hypothetical protein HY249_01050 [Candidatus Azambacteria bacterium]|nr:hypothetical protein [Candidatus Azambacteria bacterium]
MKLLNKMYNSFSGTSDFLQTTLPQMSVGLVGFLGQLLLAIVLFLVFWIIGASLGKLIAEGVKSLKVDSMLAKVGVDKVAQRFGVTLDFGMFLGVVVKWFMIVAGLLSAANVLGLTGIEAFLANILSYVPNIIIAAVILVAVVFVGDFVSRVVASSVSAAGLKSAPFVSKIAKWSIFVFAFIAALDQLQVAQTFINTLYIGIVTMIALAGGLAFGLGGKEHASEFIAKVKRDISER